MPSSGRCVANLSGRCTPPPPDGGKYSVTIRTFTGANDRDGVGSATVNPANAVRARSGALLRRAARGAATLAGADVSVTVDGLRYIVDRSDDGPGRGLFIWRVLPEFAALERALELLAANGESASGRLLVDVGANIGTTCLPAVARHGLAGAIAIEPDARNARVLRANADLNGLADRVQIVEAAAADEEGQATFAAGKATKGGRHRSGAGALRAGGEAVRVVTVDAELARRGVAAGDVGLLWADVQGHEAKVALGAQSLLEAARPFVFAARIRKLEQLGDGETLVSLIGTHYRSVVELRAGGPAVVRPAAELGELLRASPMTDVLAFGSA